MVRAIEHRRAALPGIHDFGGLVLSSSHGRADELPADGVIGCIGIDQAMVDLVPQLVGQGRDVRFFIERPRAVAPERPFPNSGLAGVALLFAGVVRQGQRRCPIAQVPFALAKSVAALHHQLEHAAAMLELRARIADPWLRRQLAVRAGDSERALHGDGFYRSIVTPNCRLVFWPIAKVTETGVRTCDGLEHRVSAIVVAT